MKYNKKPFFKHTEVFENNNRNYLNENMLQIINIVAWFLIFVKLHIRQIFLNYIVIKHIVLYVSCFLCVWKILYNINSQNTIKHIFYIFVYGVYIVQGVSEKKCV